MGQAAGQRPLPSLPAGPSSRPRRATRQDGRLEMFGPTWWNLQVWGVPGNARCRHIRMLSKGLAPLSRQHRAPALPFRLPHLPICSACPACPTYAVRDAAAGRARKRPRHDSSRCEGIACGAARAWCDAVACGRWPWPAAQCAALPCTPVYLFPFFPHSTPRQIKAANILVRCPARAGNFVLALACHVARLPLSLQHRHPYTAPSPSQPYPTWQVDSSLAGYAPDGTPIYAHKPMFGDGGCGQMVDEHW